MLDAHESQKNFLRQVWRIVTITQPLGKEAPQSLAVPTSDL
jgi:hypothetical protein